MTLSVSSIFFLSFIKCRADLACLLPLQNSSPTSSRSSRSCSSFTPSRNSPRRTPTSSDPSSLLHSGSSGVTSPPLFDSGRRFSEEEPTRSLPPTKSKRCWESSRSSSARTSTTSLALRSSRLSSSACLCTSCAHPVSTPVRVTEALVPFDLAVPPFSLTPGPSSCSCRPGCSSPRRRPSPTPSSTSSLTSSPSKTRVSRPTLSSRSTRAFSRGKSTSLLVPPKSS